MRRWLIHERHLSVLTAQAREATIVTITQRQAMTASRNSRMTRCLKQDPTHLYKDATSSLPDATSSEAHWGDGHLQHKQGVVQPDVCSPLDMGRTTTTVVLYHQHESLPKSVLNSSNLLVSRSQEQNDVTAQLWSKKLNMRCTCCLLILTLWSAAARCNNRMQMCIGSFSLHSKWIGLLKRDPNSSAFRHDIENDRLIAN